MVQLRAPCGDEAPAWLGNRVSKNRITLKDFHHESQFVEQKNDRNVIRSLTLS